MSTKKGVTEWDLRLVVQKAEQERDEARAEVERLQAERAHLLAVAKATHAYVHTDDGYEAFWDEITSALAALPPALAKEVKDADAD